MREVIVSSLLEQFQDVREALQSPDAVLRRNALKAEIIALYRAVEREITALSSLKEDVKGLVQHWKALEDPAAEAVHAVGAPLPAEDPVSAPHPAPSSSFRSAEGGERRVEHSTFTAISASKVESPVAGSEAADTSDAVTPAPDEATSVPGAREDAVIERSTASEERSTASSTPTPTVVPTRADHLNASTYLEKGWSLISLGDHAGAEAALGRALELSPNDPHGESLLGWAQMLQEKYDEALLNFQKVLMRQPQNSLARINVGYICLKKKIFGEAIEHLSKAIRLDNDRKATLYAHYYLGLLYLEREMYEDAQNFLKKAIALGPNLIEAYYELGRAIFFAGDRGGAMGAWRDGMRANKFNPWGKRCAEMLQHVESGGEPPRS